MSYSNMVLLRVAIAGALAAGALVFGLGYGTHAEWQAYLAFSTFSALVLVWLARGAERRPNQFLIAHKTVVTCAALLAIAALILLVHQDDHQVAGLFEAVVFGGVALCRRSAGRSDWDQPLSGRDGRRAPEPAGCPDTGSTFPLQPPSSDSTSSKRSVFVPVMPNTTPPAADALAPASLVQIPERDATDLICLALGLTKGQVR